MYLFRNQTRRRALTLLTSLALLVGIGATNSEAAKKPKPSNISVVPTITPIALNAEGQLVASGLATATIKGTSTTVPFENVPVTLGLSATPAAPGACPVLDLSLGPITLDLLGLVVETSPICLEITAIPGGGLLGDLLCSVAGLLNGGLALDQILGGQSGLAADGLTVLPGLTPVQVGNLLGGLQDLLNRTLQQLLGSLLEAILPIDANRTCSVLHLELGPLELNLLGLLVELDDCDGGPVVVDITAQTGQGKLLGNLLCELLGGGGINLGTTLQNLLNQILGLLNQ